MGDRAERRPGLVLAASASVVSGIAVFLNSYAVKHVHASPTTYTMAKNLVAAMVLWAILATAAPKPVGIERRGGAMASRLGLAYVGLVGGGLAFALFFEGLSQTSATTAAFVQKSLVIWVIALAVPLLGERVGLIQWSAVALLVAGATALGATKGGLTLGKGPALILAATVLWAIEIIIVKRLLASIPALRLGLTRMGAGTMFLVLWLAVTGRLTQLGNLGRSGWAWVILTGAVLAIYVSTWFAALARGRAIDVTAVLVSAAFITAVLSAGAQGTSLPRPWALVLIAVGTAIAAAEWQRDRLTPSKAPPT